MIDLHSHSTASDGEHAPKDVVQLAHQAGVTHLSITDHDTVAGLAESAEASRALGMTFIAGIELSAFVQGREIHILGHFIDPAAAGIVELAALQRDERRQRMRAMVEKMRALGYPVTMEQVLAVAGEAQLGRPHLALALVQAGCCKDIRDAFNRFLADGKPGWADRWRLPGEEAVRLIREAGGCATVAHPGVSKVNRYELGLLKEAGLAGLEVHHMDHVPSLRASLTELAQELDLVPTGGSDFHGPRVTPGRKLGDATMDRASFDALQARARA